MSQRGPAPGTGARGGDLPSRLSQSCSPTVIVGQGLLPPPQPPDTLVWPNSSRQPASQSPGSVPEPLSHGPFWSPERAGTSQTVQSRGRFQETVSPTEPGPAFSVGGGGVSDLTLPDIPYPSYVLAGDCTPWMVGRWAGDQEGVYAGQ